MLQLTGSIPLLPDYAMGTWFTWYHNYTAGSKLAEIRQWHRADLPLDVASLDMDWRLHPCYPNSITPNCSDTPNTTEAQYVVNRELIPDMPGFLAAAHALGVKMFFNDHPMTPGPLPRFAEMSPAEVVARQLLHRYSGERGVV